ncbi:MAG: GNAT family N-acetyltransferase [Candidatus Kapabacteria bacterium]|nr:GNAT family N-acetyltransferase [Candidatus Kapabacteria bacterium]
MKDITIRIARIGDEEQIARINVETWRVTYSGLIHDSMLKSLSIEKRTDDWKRIIGNMNDAHCTIVATNDDGIILGYCGGGTARREGYQWEVYALYVHPMNHKSGIGKELLKSYITLAMAAQWTHLGVVVLQGNPARGFYEHCGAKYTGSFTHPIDGIDYWQDELVWKRDEIILTRKMN